MGMQTITIDESHYDDLVDLNNNRAVPYESVEEFMDFFLGLAIYYYQDLLYLIDRDCKRERFLEAELERLYNGTVVLPFSPIKNKFIPDQSDEPGPYRKE